MLNQLFIFYIYIYIFPLFLYLHVSKIIIPENKIYFYATSDKVKFFILNKLKFFLNRY